MDFSYHAEEIPAQLVEPGMKILVTGRGDLEVVAVQPIQTPEGWDFRITAADRADEEHPWQETFAEFEPFYVVRSEGDFEAGARAMQGEAVSLLERYADAAERNGDHVAAQRFIYNANKVRELPLCQRLLKGSDGP